VANSSRFKDCLSVALPIIYLHLGPLFLVPFPFGMLLKGEAVGKVAGALTSGRRLSKGLSEGGRRYNLGSWVLGKAEWNAVLLAAQVCTLLLLNNGWPGTSN
jgi:hypothetical protein